MIGRSDQAGLDRVRPELVEAQDGFLDLQRLTGTAAWTIPGAEFRLAVMSSRWYQP